MMRFAASSGDRRQRALSRSGYTLLELLIASVLIATLMAAAWNLMTMYSSFLIAGRSQAAEQQLARSVMDLLVTDLRAVVPERDAPFARSAHSPVFNETMAGVPSFEPNGRSDSRGRSSFTGLPSSGSSRFGAAASDASQFGSPFSGSSSTEMSGLVGETLQLPEFSLSGDERSLTLVVVQSRLTFSPRDDDDEFSSATPRDDFAPDATGARSGEMTLPARPQAKEWTQVVYQFEPPRTVRKDERGLRPGLHRFEIPVEYLGLLTESAGLGGDEFSRFDGSFGDDSSSNRADQFERLQEQGGTALSHEWIPEVVGCRFEFLTESGWLPFWDELGNHDRPLAVRVQLKLLSPSEHAKLMAALGSTESDEDGFDAEDGFDRRANADKEFAEPSQPLGGGADPFAAFRPRLFERMVLLGAERIALPRGERNSPGERRSPGPADLLVGGQP